MNRLLVAVLLSWLGASSARAQTDSLLNVLAHSPEDTAKIQLFIRIGSLYERNNTDSAAFYYQAAGNLSARLHDTKGTLDYISYYTGVLNIQNRFRESLFLNQKAVGIASQLHDDRKLAVAYCNTAASYYGLNAYDSCVDFFLKAVTLLEKTKDSTRLMFVYGNIAGVYQTLQQPSKSYIYGLKSVAMSRAMNNQSSLAGALINTGNALIDLKRYDSATVLLQQAIGISRQIQDVYNEETAVLQMAEIYKKTGQFQLLQENGNNALALATKVDDQEGVSRAHIYLAWFYFFQRDYEKARVSSEQALKIAQDSKLSSTLIDNYDQLSLIQLELHAIPAYRRYADLADSFRQAILSDQLIKNTQELDARYSLSKKQDEIDRLGKEQKIQDLELRQKRLINWVLVAVVLFVMIIGLLLFRGYRRKRKLLLTEASLQQQRISELEKERQLLATQAVVQGQEEERTRLAKDLHDGLGGILSSTKYSLSNMKQNLIITPENASAFERTMAMLDQSISELRRVAHNMMPESLMKLSLTEAIQDYCTQVSQSGALEVRYQGYGNEKPGLDNAVRITVYRVIQELVNNVIKHAGAHRATVQLMYQPQQLNITVEDDGRGFDTASLDSVEGIGYRNLRSRVDFLRGSLDIQSIQGKGTSVYIEIPLAGSTTGE